MALQRVNAYLAVTRWQHGTFYNTLAHLTSRMHLKASITEILTKSLGKQGKKLNVWHKETFSYQSHISSAPSNLEARTLIWNFTTTPKGIRWAEPRFVSLWLCQEWLKYTIIRWQLEQNSPSVSRDEFYWICSPSNFSRYGSPPQRLIANVIWCIAARTAQFSDIQQTWWSLLNSASAPLGKQTG